LLHLFNRVFRFPVPFILIVKLLAEHFAASFCNFIWVISIIIERQISFLDFKLPWTNDKDLVWNVALLVYYLILDKSLGLKNKINKL
jgi:hypothetical protein